MVKNKLAGIYAVKCLENNKILICFSQNIEERILEEKSCLKTGKHYNEYLSEDYKKFGPEKINFEIIETIPQATLKQLKERKDYWIKHYNSTNENFGFNLATTDGSFVSQRVRDKLSKIISEIPRTKEHNQNISKSKMGMKFSKEHKTNISKSLKEYYSDKVDSVTGLKIPRKILNKMCTYKNITIKHMETGEELNFELSSDFNKYFGCQRNQCGELVRGKLSSYKKWICTSCGLKTNLSSIHYAIA